MKISKAEKEIIKQVNDGALTREEAMATLGLSQAAFYRHKRKLGIERLPGIRKREMAATKATREARETAARMVIEGRVTFEEGLAITKIHRTSLQRIIDRVKARAE